ncbi:hypothetical protein GY45DRAFT_1329566 [Cubamyces sp. BRFM 1775]|nr:hypothetical protein GY45DRAFT_1329566 [Cubamyces sp. BRFM 1775]
MYALAFLLAAFAIAHSAAVPVKGPVTTVTTLDVRVIAVETAFIPIVTTGTIKTVLTRSNSEVMVTIEVVPVTTTVAEPYTAVFTSHEVVTTTISFI